MRLPTALLLLAPALLAWSSESASQEQRIRTIEESLLAPCCWSETIAVHRSEISLQMRAEISRFVEQGKTDREILDYYKKLHGARILVEPEGLARWLVYSIPAIAAATGVFLVALLIRRSLRADDTQQPEPSA